MTIYSTGTYKKKLQNSYQNRTQKICNETKSNKVQAIRGYTENLSPPPPPERGISAHVISAEK
jgi:hypothetical protein